MHFNLILLILDILCMIYTFTYVMEVYVLCKLDNVFKADCISLQSISTAITIFEELSEMFAILEKLFSDCIVPIQNGCKLCYIYLLVLL